MCTNSIQHWVDLRILVVKRVAEWSFVLVQGEFWPSAWGMGYGLWTVEWLLRENGWLLRENGWLLREIEALLRGIQYLLRDFEGLLRNCC
ncbi:hypothetical protein KH172YL63_06400 [Bacillus sp. KH172YL63]|nr:hypothetical protein KH172YL63_06400 [Bacillus sp. KH172YL63]